MKTYLRHKTSTELLDDCAARGIPADTTKFDQGGDHIVVTLPAGPFGEQADVLYNVVSGRFFCVPKEGKGFSSDSSAYDGEPWFAAMLDLFYVDREPAPATAA